MDKPVFSLCEANQRAWQEIISRVLTKAERDHERKWQRRSGKLLAELCCTGDVRRRHYRLLTTIYNQYRDELENRDQGV